MKKELKVCDTVVVNKINYEYNKYSNLIGKFGKIISIWRDLYDVILDDGSVVAFYFDEIELISYNKKDTKKFCKKNDRQI